MRNRLLNRVLAVLRGPSRPGDQPARAIMQPHSGRFVSGWKDDSGHSGPWTVVGGNRRYASLTALVRTGALKGQQEPPHPHLK